MYKPVTQCTAACAFAVIKRLALAHSIGFCINTTQLYGCHVVV